VVSYVYYVDLTFPALMETKSPAVARKNVLQPIAVSVAVLTFKVI